ncbi:hypothetical protein [Chryseobacterium manosquense]|uniref:hypothetical protein n=1 Tax=Chryseobacterium manosquense TaxID=2754694 RepID=UPI0021CF4EA7|nr:hypothetical protein [Chryseobacterium manosquense]
MGRSKRTFDNYSRHVAALALHFGKVPTELDPEDIKDYLFELQKRSKTPSQSYFKHTVYGLRFLLKTEGLPYSYLHLPAIPKVKKLPTILSREEIWRLLQSAELLKHKLLIGLIYGCGLRCMEVRNIKLHTQNAVCKITFAGKGICVLQRRKTAENTHKDHKRSQKKAVLPKNCFVNLNSENDIPIRGPSYC